jgi:hypothetical protein
MGTLGKILLFVNFVAFAGLTYFASQDWLARHAAATNALKHQLVIVGMPVTAPTGIEGDSENIPLGTTVSGFYPVETVRPGLLKDLFSGTGSEEYAGGEFPKTQMDQLDAAYKAASAKLSGLKPDELLAQLGGTYTKSPETKTVRFQSGWLASMAETTVERALIRKLCEPTQFERTPEKKEANAKTLMAIWEKKFETLKKVDAKQADAEATQVKEATDAVRAANDEGKRKFAAYSALISKPDSDPTEIQTAAKDAAAALDKLTDSYSGLQKVIATIGTTACRDEGDRKKRIAHVLMHLSDTPAWQKRVALTVGLKTYLSALSDHANRIQRYASAAEAQVVLDQARFADEYDLLKNLAIGQALLLKQEVAVRTDLQLQRSKDEEAVKVRLLLLEDRRKTLDDINKRVEAALTAQAETEKRLFDVQKLVGETLQRNFGLEDQLEKVEAKK